MDAWGETEPGCPAAGCLGAAALPGTRGMRGGPDRRHRGPGGAATLLAWENRDVRPDMEEWGCSLSTLNFCQQPLCPAMTKFTFPYLLCLSRPRVSFHFLTALTYPPGFAAR